MAWSQTDLDTLDAAIATGVRKVRYADREVEYQSIPDMLIARTELVNTLSKTNGPKQVRMVQIYTRSGF